MIPDISIIVTNYNYGRYLDRCLRSCLKQRRITYEVILVDDCSTDNTQEIIRPFLNEISFFQTSENVGVAGASNVGIMNAKGRFVVRVDADDYINEDLCFFLHFYLQNNRDAFGVSCDYILVDEFENKIERKYAERDNISCGIMYRKDLLLKVNGYNESFRHREEEELRKRLGGFYNIHHLRLPLYRYRMHNSNKTKTPGYMETEV